MSLRSHSLPGRLPFLLSGFLWVLAYPPIGLSPLAWIALVPFLLPLRKLTFSAAFRRGWWTGLIFNAGLLYWIALNSGAEKWIAVASFISMLFILPLYWAVFAGCWAFLWRRWGDMACILLPAIWVGLEVIKNLPEIGFPWLELGLTQITFSPAAQLAELGGIRFVSAWVVGANIVFFLFIVRKRRVSYILSLLLFVGILWGWWRQNNLPESGSMIKAAIVQGNVDPAAKWREDPDSSVALYENLTINTLNTYDPDVVIWPETAAPVYLAHQRKYQAQLRNLAHKYNVSILTGAPHYELNPQAKQGHERYNSAFFFPEDGSPPLRYDKIRLVPFGERVPFQRWFPILGELNFGQAEFTAGENYNVFSAPNGVKFSAQICFESIFGSETRQFVLKGARVLCNLTNDGWYGYSSGPFQHAALVRFQCIETRCPLLRSANTGISLVADRRGRVIKSLPLNERGVLFAEVESGSDDLTFHTRYGDLLPHGLALIGLIGLGISLFTKPKEDWRC